jgi:hypothetical protein
LRNSLTLALRDRAASEKWQTVEPKCLSGSKSELGHSRPGRASSKSGHVRYAAPKAEVISEYDKLAANYLAFIKLASIRIWLRANESTPYQRNRRSGEENYIRRTTPGWPSGHSSASRSHFAALAAAS